MHELQLLKLLGIGAQGEQCHPLCTLFDSTRSLWIPSSSMKISSHLASRVYETLNLLTPVLLQGLLSAFVEYIKDRKTVVLEDLAAHFSLRVQV